MKKKKIMETSSRAAHSGSGFFRNYSGGQEINLSPMTTEEKAGLISELAAGSESGFGGVEEMITSMVRANPDFHTSEEEGRRGIVLGLITLFEQLSDEEAETAVMLHSLCAESHLDDSRWDAVQLSLIPEEYRDSVRNISNAEQKEKAAIQSGEVRSSGNQMPFLICEHAKRIVQDREYLHGRALLERALWDVHEDESLSMICRSALEIIVGRSSYHANIVVDSLARSRIEELGIGGAIAEAATIWKILQSEGIGENVIKDALFAFGHTYDEGVEPTFGALNILSEISQSGMSMIDPRLTIIAAARKVSGK